MIDRPDAGVPPLAAAPDLDALLKLVPAEEPGARRKAFEELLSLGAREAAGALVAKLVEPGHGDDNAVRIALHGLAVHAARPGAEAERAAAGGALARALEGERPPGVKGFIIEQLQIAGGAESVPALARALSEEALAAPACAALGANPSAEAAAALLDALPKAVGDSRLAVIMALGKKRHPGATEALLPLAAAEDEAERRAALEALGDLGDPRAEPILLAALRKGPERLRRVALDAAATLGARLVDAGRKGEAAELFLQLLEVAEASHERCAALGGLGRSGAGELTARVIASLGDADPSVRRAAARALAVMPGEWVGDALEAAASEADGELKAVLERVRMERRRRVRI
jgi:HEAT repeat protein